MYYETRLLCPKKKHVKIFNLFEILIMLLLFKVLFANKTVGVVEFLVFFLPIKLLRVLETVMGWSVEYLYSGKCSDLGLSKLLVECGLVTGHGRHVHQLALQLLYVAGHTLHRTLGSKHSVVVIDTGSLLPITSVCI